eukprot:gene37216-50217_t
MSRWKLIIQKDKRFLDGVEVVEGTSGSTGISLALICQLLGGRVYMLTTIGAKVTIVSSCSISNKNHYVNTARRIADEINGIFMNQFVNMANYRAHYV